MPRVVRYKSSVNVLNRERHVLCAVARHRKCLSVVLWMTTETASGLLTNWLLGNGPPPSASVLRAARLAPYAHSVLPAPHPLRAELRRDYVASLGRHQRLKAELQPLLRAWRAADLDVLLFKGFQLSEFVYPRAGARFHGDVDVLLAPHQRDRAEHIARELGWHSARPVTWTHNAFCLSRAGGGTRVDAHLEILHVVLPWYRAQQRITEAVWRSARIRLWNGIDIREPCPVDMLLVALVLQRCWGAERWQLKPHDVVDFQYISALDDVSREALWERACALGCERTLAAFLARCDPDSGLLDLRPIAPRERRQLDRAAFHERGLLGGPERMVARALRAPTMTPVGLSFVPLVMRIRRTVRRHPDMRSLLEAVSAMTAAGPLATRLSRELVIAGVRYATRLVGSGRSGPCLVRALAVYAALRQRGWPVEFVTGVRRRGAAIVGHAWVECDGDVLLEMEEPNRCALYEQNFRFPVRAITPAVPDPVSVASIRDPRSTAELVARIPRG